MHSKAVQLGIWVLLATSITWAQVELPRNLASYQSPLVPESEARSTNSLLGGVVLGSVFDDNLTLSRTSPISGCQESVSAYLALEQRRRHWDLSLTSNSSYTRYQHYVNPNQYSNQVAARFALYPSRRLRVSLGQSYTVTADPYLGITEGLFGSGPGPIVAPNNSFLLPQTGHRSMISDAEVSYQLSRLSVIGVTGSFSNLTFDDTPAALEKALRNTRTVAGSAYFMHEISKRHQVGVQYAYMDFYSGRNARTQANTILLMDRIRAGAVELAIFAGPESAHSSNVLLVDLKPAPVYVPVRSRAWTASAGATLEWRTHQHALRIKLLRRVSDGGGLMSAVKTSSGSVVFHSRLTRRIASDLAFSINDNRGLDLFAEAMRMTSGAVSAGLTYHLARNLSLRTSYTHVRQTGLRTLEGYGDHNRVQLSFDYRFMRALGR